LSDGPVSNASTVGKENIISQGIGTVQISIKLKNKIEMVRAMLIKANVLKDLWAEAINTNVFLCNRCLPKTNDGKTPYEL